MRNSSTGSTLRAVNPTEDIRQNYRYDFRLPTTDGDKRTLYDKVWDFFWISDLSFFLA